MVFITGTTQEVVHSCGTFPRFRLMLNMYHTVGLHSTLIFCCSFPTCVERDRMVVGEVGYGMEYSEAEGLGDG